MNTGLLMTLLEKSHYPFRNYPQESCTTLLFSGCSFPSQFPRTMDALAVLCREHGVGVAYDCCGKPVAELKRDAVRITQGMTKRLERLGVGEVVCLCPNCMEYLGETLDLPVISVYALLSRWGYACQGLPPSGVVFRPCPDRKEGRILEEISELLPLEGLRTMERVPCCGLRGDIAIHGPAAGDKLCALAKEQAAGETIYTYCASCSGQFQRHGCGQVRHLLSPLLGVEEEPDAARALLNRARRKFRK
ncbi:hypothetical protein Desde_3321 [Desulfitobacterium dehalogenans ATCC 51507]|uniref:Cysteine-rich domain-containing protein n=1 Tax=Desulfitobacterium dehalogenans (strain ATCC 51507 / DSM 9161 / JW/IU-DC1) TaxID=756499 RepID=I4ACC4_DESDJ|nr:heterodisulfide reductase-related iron-sulfur binding cluster [Desulfitobacterium dehalogenans]AFM01609.1 hypothetical protein Desde_3321 [Desulfitobacterium dehalogenans ATCC 51507]